MTGCVFVLYFEQSKAIGVHQVCGDIKIYKFVNLKFLHLELCNSKVVKTFKKINLLIIV